MSESRITPEGMQQADQVLLEAVDVALYATLERIASSGVGEHDDAVLRQLHWIRRDISTDYRA